MKIAITLAGLIVAAALVVLALGHQPAIVGHPRICATAPAGLDCTRPGG